MFFNQDDYIVFDDLGQAECLKDESGSGREQPWRNKKLNNLLVSESFERLGYNKESDRLNDCGTVLEFKGFPDGSKKLKQANFCKIRLCPTCGWRRSKKIYSQTNKIMHAMSECEEKYVYLFVTLTVPSVSGENLSVALDKLFAGWVKFMRFKAVADVVKGWYRGLEVTHNLNKKSKSYNTYHPHFHCVLAVNLSYFLKGKYLNQGKWLALWQRAMGDESITQVDVRRVYGDTARSVCEIAKYAVKDSDYVLPKDKSLMDETVEVLKKALHGRRLAAYGGIMKDLHKKLNLDDAVDGDLIHIGEEEEEADKLGYEIISYVWGVGYNGRQDFWRAEI